MDKTINNWKLKESIQKVEIVSYEGLKKLQMLLSDRNIQLSNDFNPIIRGSTLLDWSKIEDYQYFSFDDTSIEETLKKMFSVSKLQIAEYLILIYYHDKLAVKIYTDDFVNEWEDFLQSVLYETVIFLDKSDYFMEVTRDYKIHSNFRIWDDEIL